MDKNGRKMDQFKHKGSVAGTEPLTRDISIWLDGYDDIFSDFDPRPYSERTLSDDFITEVEKVCGESEFKVNELKLLLPEKVRNKETESVIIKRLHLNFRKNLQRSNDERKLIIKKGLLLFILGTILMSLTAYISDSRSEKLGSTILLVIMEPAGWFMVWMGLDNMFYLLKKKKLDFDFHTKMGKSKPVFVSI